MVRMKNLFLIITLALIIFHPTPSVVIEEVRPQRVSGGVQATLPSPVATDEAKVKVSSTEWNTFVETARPIAKKYDIPLKVMLGQAALETGYGRSWQAQARNNWFGLGAYNNNTSFAYSSIEECIEYYAKLISSNARYSKAYEARNNPEKMIREIKNSGYASDPLYVEKVTSLGVWNHY